MWESGCVFMLMCALTDGRVVQGATPPRLKQTIGLALQVYQTAENYKEMPAIII